MSIYAETGPPRAKRSQDLLDQKSFGAVLVLIVAPNDFCRVRSDVNDVDGRHRRRRAEVERVGEREVGSAKPEPG